ncbi:MAG TPA: branched-chain amino acid ABC transporter permease [Propionibacteriaceae bacterium]|jgi:ABC-type branched-chain amino acid transport system, permease component
MTAPRVAGKRRRGIKIALGVGGVLALGVFPNVREALGASTYMLVFLYFVFFWTVQATSWNIFSGYAGYLNFGQNAFYGIGVYTTALLVEHWGVPLLAVLPLAAATGFIASILAGLLVFRLRTLEGEIFALFTLALGLGLGLVVSNVGAIDGGQGIVLPDISYPEWLGSTNEMLYRVGLVLAVIAILVARYVQRSRMGYGLAAIRDDEHVARTLGVPTFRYKLAAFGIGGALAAASGALQAVLISFVTPASAFGPEVPMFVILMSFIGGRRHWMGPVIGAVLIFTLSDRLTNVGLAEANNLIIGILLIVVVVGLRSGIVDQLMVRWRAAAIAAAIPLVALVTLGRASDVIGLMLWAMLGALAILLVPQSVYVRYVRRGVVPAAEPAAGRGSPEERLEALAAKDGRHD